MSRNTQAERDFEDGYYFGDYYPDEYGSEAALDMLGTLTEGDFKNGYRKSLEDQGIA